MKLTISKEKVKFYLWTGLAFFMLWELYNIANHPGTLFFRTINELWRALYIIVINYILFEFTIPRLHWRRIFSSFLLIAGHILLYSFGGYAWRGIGILFQVYTPFTSYPSIEQGADNHFQYSVGSIAFFAVVRHIYGHIKLKQAAQQLRIEKQQAELNYLKSQTNPHFLFNTLNNIYSLARDKSDLAPESILRLSKILRFMLYEAGGDYIPLETELKIIKDYIELEKLRYDETLRVNFVHELQDNTLQLPPLLLIPLVENAFKHGVSETVNEPFIDIMLMAGRGNLNFVVKNSTGKANAEEVKENIGLSNLRRQLKLLYKDYELSLEQGEYIFTARLSINLTSHA
jgi:hypothetical protein